jgi:hypothetical protein
MKFAPSKMRLTSAAFADGGAIPKGHTGEGPNTSPPLAIADAPAGTRSLAVICHDPDAPVVARGGYGFVHWVLYNIPAGVRELAEGTTAHTAGVNDFGKPGYGGPMPPPGHGTHRYYFWVLALDGDLGLPAGMSMADLLARVEPHVLGMNRLVGTYSRG